MTDEIAAAGDAPHQTSVASRMRETFWLIWTLSVRQYRQRYQGSLLGPLWPFLYTFAMLGLYSLVFSVILQVKWAQSGITSNAVDVPFWVILFSGQVIFFFVSETLIAGPSLVLSVPNYVKKIRFPLETLPVVTLLVTLFTLGINMLLLFGSAAYFVGVQWTLVFVPFIIVQACLWCLGIGWLLGAFGVFFRDLQQVMPVISQLLFFATPIVYPLEAVPQEYRFLLQWNPIAVLVEDLRGAVLWGRTPELFPFCLWTAGAVLFAWCGYWMFQRLRQTFADVM